MPAESSSCWLVACCSFIPPIVRAFCETASVPQSSPVRLHMSRALVGVRAFSSRVLAGYVKGIAINMEVKNTGMPQGTMGHEPV